MTKPSPFQDAPATRWERGRTCPAMTRQGGASACPTWWGTTATSARPSTGRWGAARAAGPAAATRTAPAAPTATRYCPAHPEHPQGRFSTFQQYFFFISLPSFMHTPASLLSFFLLRLCKRCCEGLLVAGVELHSRECHGQRSRVPAGQHHAGDCSEHRNHMVGGSVIPSHPWEPPQKGLCIP